MAQGKTPRRAQRRNGCAEQRALEWLEPASRSADQVSFDRLLHISAVVNDLGRRLAAGEDVSGRVAAIDRAAFGASADTVARRNLIHSIARVAATTDDDIGRMMWCGRPADAPLASDEQLCGLVCIPLSRGQSAQYVARLSTHHAEVALAVRLWRRGKGRPKTGEPRGSKWTAIAKVIELAGLGRVDEKAVEQLWKEHRIENP